MSSLALVVAADPTSLAARWLSPGERWRADARGQRGRAGHVAGRVAAKHAIGDALRRAGLPVPHPVAVEIDNDEHGRPVTARPVSVSIAHSGRVGAAIATVAVATDGSPLGLDLEPVAPRSTRFEHLVLTPAEHALAPPPGDDRDTWLTRVWAAKETAAKAAGRGLQGRPKAFEVVEVAGSHLRIGERWVRTEVRTVDGSPHVLAVTGPEEVLWPSS